MDKKKEKFIAPKIVVIELDDNDLVITDSAPATPVVPFVDVFGHNPFDNFGNF